MTGGGQNKKKQSTSGRPKGVAPAMCITTMQSIAPHSFYSSTLQPPQYSTPETYHIRCSICKGVPERPLELLCGNIACLQCCCSSVQSSGTPTCPCCKSTTLCDVSSNHFQCPSKVTMSVLGNMVVNCSRGCNRSVRIMEYQQHLETNCQHHFEHSTLSPSNVTARDILSRSADTSTTPVVRRVAATVIRKLMTENPDRGLIKIPTQGRVSFIVKILCVTINQ